MGRTAAIILFLSAVFSAAALMPPCHTVRLEGTAAGADSIAGPWEWRGNDVYFRLLKSPASDGYDFVIIDSFDATVPCEAAKGRLKALMDDRKFDLYLETEDAAGHRRLVQAFIATFNSDWSRLSLHAYNRHRKLTLERLFPYIFRIAVSNNSPRPNDVEGAVNLNLSRQEGEIVL